MSSPLALLLVALLLAPAAAKSKKNKWTLLGHSSDRPAVYYSKSDVHNTKKGRIATWVKTSHPKYGETTFTVRFDRQKDDVYWAKSARYDLEPDDLFYKLRAKMLKMKPKK